ncbi:MAG: Smr/MutS family protein [Lachnospiraceae bacterium]|jgi:DNA-nicking Smr family endonuclease|nr:Smr/MutS family protein [Lachnospiraceae bacterium]
MTPAAEERLEMVLTDTELRRIWGVQGGPVYIDLHGLSCREARRLLGNVINLLRGPASIKVIHGYHHGTALRDMVRTNFCNIHVYAVQPDDANQGLTTLQVA